MKISIVSTMYQSAPYLEEFCARVCAAASQIGGDFEIVLVNDGSPDDSLARAIALADRDERISVVDLSRNFGHHKAIMTGLAHARGDYVFLIDCDLEESPEWLTSFWDELHQRRCDVVYGVQERRKGGWFERFSGEIFYRLYNLCAGVKIPNNLVTARLMSRRYVESLLRFTEREIFLAGLWTIAGFEQQPKPVNKLQRSATTYTLRRKISLMVNSVTSFSVAPLVGIFYIGALIFVTACAWTVYLVLNWLFFAHPLTGWTSVMVSIWFFGGLIISFIGVVGIYLSKVFMEAKQRPFSIVRQVYGKRVGDRR